MFCLCFLITWSVFYLDVENDVKNERTEVTKNNQKNVRVFRVIHYSVETVYYYVHHHIRDRVSSGTVQLLLKLYYNWIEIRKYTTDKIQGYLH